MGLRRLWRSWFPPDFPKPDFTPPGFQGRATPPEDVEEPRKPKTYDDKPILNPNRNGGDE